MPSETTQDGESVPIPEDLRHAHKETFWQPHQGIPVRWNSHWIRLLIERIGRAEAALREMTKDRDLWREAHDEDCPNLALLDIAREECKEAEAALADRDNHIALAYGALGEVNKAVYLSDHIRILKEKLEAALDAEHTQGWISAPRDAGGRTGPGRR